MTDKLNLFDGVDLVEFLPRVSQPSTINGDAVDMKDYVGKVAAMLASTAGGGTNPSLDAVMQDSEDGTTDWQDIPGGAFPTITDLATGLENIGIIVDATRRFWRAQAVIAGIGPQFEFAVTALARKKYG